MSEEQLPSESQVVGGSPAVSETRSVSEKRPRRGRVAAVAGAVLMAAALVAGTGYTVVTVRDADRDAGAPQWKFPEEKAADEKAPSASGLAGMLVPYGTDEWVRGPDLGEFGSDRQFSEAEATALRRQSLRELPRSQRLELEKRADRLRVKGVAMRSYLSGDAGGDQDFAEGIYSVGIVLSRLDSRAAARDMVTLETGFLGALEIFRKGPEVKGHKDAKCFLAPKEFSEELDSMSCVGYVGDVLVSVAADGVRPLDSKAVATLLSTQLDRIAEPGKAV